MTTGMTVRVIYIFLRLKIRTVIRGMRERARDRHREESFVEVALDVSQGHREIELEHGSVVVVGGMYCNVCEYRCPVSEALYRARTENPIPKPRAFRVDGGEWQEIEQGHFE